MTPATRSPSRAGNDTTYRPPDYWNEACRALETCDETLKRVLTRHGSNALRGSGNALRTLLNAVIGQQISVAAAEGIWRRFLATYPSVDARAIASADPAALRAIGLSNRKVEYVTGIARAFAAGDVKPAQWSSLADDALRDHLTSLRGVGPWTADMVLIFHERRPDVLPLGDVGLVNAAARLYGWDAPDLRARRETLRVHAERWRPWRSVATWYIWLELDAEPVVY